VDYYDDGQGVSLAAILLGALALVSLLLWLNAELRHRADVAPPPPASPPPSPPKAPAPPAGVTGRIEAELITLRQQIAAYSVGDLDPIVGPASARILELIKDFEARAAAHHEKLKGMIEK
jgi:hypothetical protein